MTIADIGQLYDVNKVKVGSAAGFIMDVTTPDPPDSLTVFDPAVWQSSTVTLKTTTPPTGGTFLITLDDGPFLVPTDTAAIAFGAAASAVKAAVDLILPEDYESIVSGAAGGPYKVAFEGSRGGDIVVDIDGALLTGGSGTSTATGTPYIAAGGTEQGWQVAWNPQTADIRIDEQPTPVDQQLDTATLQFVANLAQDTFTSWAFALNADKTVIAPASGVFGKNRLTPSTVLKRYKVVLETQSDLDLPRRFKVPLMTCAGNVGALFKRSGTQRLIPVTFTSICQFNQITIDEITAAAL